MESIFSLTRPDLEAWLSRKNYYPGHSKTLFRQIYRDLTVGSWKQDETLPRSLTTASPGAFSWGVPAVHDQKVSSYDGTVKFLLRLKDDQLIETVLMPEKSRITVCLSSQAGCRQACRFCHTGKMGLLRHLTRDEIVGQIVACDYWIRENPWWLSLNKLPEQQRVTNVVFMGMGEPLDNVEEVSKAISIMVDPFGLALAPKKITVSTAGHLDGLIQFTSQNPGVGIAFSLHETDPAKRTRLMPINRRYPLEKVLDFLRDYTSGNRKHVLIQYTLINGVNDSPEQADQLAALLNQINAKVNLIPLNPVGGSSFAPPDPARLKNFQTRLINSGLRSMIRFSKGQDIAAACGQLVISRKNRQLSTEEPENR